MQVHALTGEGVKHTALGTVPPQTFWLSEHRLARLCSDIALTKAVYALTHHA